MSAPAGGAGRTRWVPGDASRYLTDTAPGHGGRNTRPLALPALTATYSGSARTGRGVAAALLGAAGGGIAWFALAQLAQPQPSVVLAVVGLVLAVAAVASAVVLGRGVVRDGASLVAAIRRWHAIAPEVPVPGVDVLTSGPAIVRLVLAGAAVLAGAGALVAAVAGSTLATWVGLGIAAAWLIGSGLLAASGWWRVRSILRDATPQADHSTFAPATAPPPVPHQAPQAPAGSQDGQRWAPPPSAPAPPPAAPWSPPPPSTAPSATTWQVAPEAVTPEQVGAEPAVAVPAARIDVEDTRLAADTTMSGRGGRSVVVLDDGTRLSTGLTLVGRDPQPRLTETDAARQVVLHPSVSKTHATFRVEAGAIHVTDRASTNGTTVVGGDGARRRLEPWTEQRLEIGETVLLGSYRVRVVADESDR